jgi:hypothetical protein
MLDGVADPTAKFVVDGMMNVTHQPEQPFFAFFIPPSDESGQDDHGPN